MIYLILELIQLLVGLPSVEIQLLQALQDRFYAPHPVSIVLIQPLPGFLPVRLELALLAQELPYCSMAIKFRQETSLVKFIGRFVLSFCLLAIKQGQVSRLEAPI